MRHPNHAEKELRTLVKSYSKKLSALNLPDALQIMSDYYSNAKDFDVLVNGDGLVAYEDITDYGLGTRVELGFTRLFLLNHKNQFGTNCPALRLRLRLCFKWDMDVIKYILPEGTWSISCWSVENLSDFKTALEQNTAYSVLKNKVPSEVNISLEETFYNPNKIHPDPNAKQNWWGVWNIG